MADVCSGDSYIQLIDKSECIGNSLDKINYNFLELDKKTCAATNYLDAMESIDGIMKRVASTNTYSTAERGFDYYKPGDILSNDLGVGGSVDIDLNLTVSGRALVAGTLQAGRLLAIEDSECLNNHKVRGSMLVYGESTFSDNVTFNGGIDVSYNSTFGENVEVVGDISAGGDVIAFSTSDERLKDKITPIQRALDKVSSINGVEFEWKQEANVSRKGKDIGVIAQEIEKVLPAAVIVRDNGYKAVKYEALIPLLVEAVKELKDQNVSLKQELEDLKSKLQ
jgi:hypothetical protein